MQGSNWIDEWILNWMGSQYEDISICVTGDWWTKVWQQYLVQLVWIIVCDWNLYLQ